MTVCISNYAWISESPVSSKACVEEPGKPRLKTAKAKSIRRTIDPWSEETIRILVDTTTMYFSVPQKGGSFAP